MFKIWCLQVKYTGWALLWSDCSFCFPLFLLWRPLLLHQLTFIRDTFTTAFVKNLIVVLVWITLTYINGTLVATFFRHQVNTPTSMQQFINHSRYKATTTLVIDSCHQSFTKYVWGSLCFAWHNCKLNWQTDETLIPFGIYQLSTPSIACLKKIPTVHRAFNTYAFVSVFDMCFINIILFRFFD